MMEKKRMMKTMDGNTAAAYISYAFTDVAAIFPITARLANFFAFSPTMARF